HAKAGKVRLVAAATEKRGPHPPGLPTISEKGPGLPTSVGVGLWGPGNRPPRLLAEIHARGSQALEHSQTTKVLAHNTFERLDLSPQDVGKLVQSDLAHWSALIKALGVKID